MIYSAADARSIATGKRAVFDEISRIEPLVMDAIEAGSLEVTVGPSSVAPVLIGFTNSTIHFNAYVYPAQYNDNEHKKAREQMNAVIKHFQLKNYQVRVSQESNTTTFNWIIKW